MRYTVHALDVWGNDEDGFSVNDVYPSSGTVDIPDDATDAQVIAALQAADYVRNDIVRENVSIDGERGYSLHIGYKARPEFELRPVSEVQS